MTTSRASRRADISEVCNTVDLVAPGDLNWSLCSSDIALFAECANENGEPSPITLFGGTSEAAPLTAGAAADVIQAYASTHNGNDPTPASVKQILMSKRPISARPRPNRAPFS